MGLGVALHGASIPKGARGVCGCITLGAMSPPPSPRPHVLTLRVSDEEIDRLEAFADRVDLSRSEAVRQLLRVGLSAVDQVPGRTAVLDLLAGLDRRRR